MKLLIVSTAPFIYKEDSVYAYGPYVAELVIWNKYVDEIAFCCPVWDEKKGLLVSKLPFRFNYHFKLIDFNLNSVSALFKALFFIFYNLIVLVRAMFWADHIHLRCPGNVGLLGCLVQILFPHKPKTAKYAGNWDPKAQQPWSYRLQQWILSNTFLTRNMQVLVYGEWEGSTKNIKPFFTATYSEKDKMPLIQKELSGKINFVYVGTLVKGKNPLYAIQLVERLSKEGHDVALSLHGEGLERHELEKYVSQNKLGGIISLYGNQAAEKVKKVYQESHFVILPSKSEGWPKAIAEGMFWGCVPISSPVSCVPDMLDHGNRGILLTFNLEEDMLMILALKDSYLKYNEMIRLGVKWSRQFTLDKFENEIIKILKHEAYYKNENI